MNPNAASLAGVSLSPPPPIAGCIRILVVEDNPAVRRLIEVVLRRAGHEVVCVEGAHKALDVLSGRPQMDVVLTDIMMPEMNGYDLAIEVRKIAPAARIVFMSGYTHDTITGIQDSAFLAKPFSAESLTSVVHHAMAAALH